MRWFGDITEKEKSEVQIVAECYTNTTVSIETAWGVFLKDVQLAVAGDAGVREHVSDSVERGVMAWGVANNPETHQRVEDWS